MKKIIIILALLIVLCSFAYADLNSNAKAYHNFTIDANDATPNNLDMSMTGATLGVGNGILDNAYIWDGGNDYGTLPSTYGLFDGTKDFSISYWVNSDEITADYDTHFLFYGETDALIQQQVTNGLISFRREATVGGWGNGATVTITQNLWYHIVFTYSATTGFKAYLNGTDQGTGSGAVVIDNSILTNSYIGADQDNNRRRFDGEMDEISIFDKTLTQTEIDFLYNSHTPNSSQQYPFTLAGLTTTLDYPINKTHYKLTGTNTSKIYNGSIIITTSKNANCTINNTNWSIIKSNSTTHHLKNNTSINYGNYSIFTDCNDGSSTNNFTFWFIIDTIPANVTLNIINNSIQGTPFNLTMNYFDEYIYLTNTTIYRESDNKILFQNASTNLSYSTEWYNLTFLVNIINSTYIAGDRIIINLSASDTHTDVKFKERPNKIKTTISNKKSNIYKLEHGLFKLEYPKDMDIEEEYNFDRMQFKLKSKKLKNKYTYQYVEADKIIYYPESEYPCHMIVNDNYWYDCVGMKEPKVTKITSTKYRIDFFMDKEEVITKSLGGLNQLSTQYIFTVNKNHTGNIYEGDFFNPSLVKFNYTSLYNFTVTSLNVNGSCIKIIGASNSSYNGDYCYELNNLKLEDVVLFSGATPVDCYITITNSSGNIITIGYDWFNKSSSIIETGFNTCDSGEIDCLLDELSGSLTSENDSITCQATLNSSWYQFQQNTSSLNTSSIGACDAVNQYPILNVSYFDESDNSVINTSSSYNVTFYDGSSYFNIELNDTSTHTTFCTDVNPATSVFNLNMFGNIILSSPSYTTRVFNIPSVSGILTSNKPYTNKSLYLIKVGNSSTIQYKWQTYDYQQIDGVMLIYRCENDGTRTLIDSTVIASGDATANLQLFTTAYSYAVSIDNVLYKDSKFYGCHVESITEREYLVDVTTAAFMPVVGLYLIDCEMTKISDTVAKMQWTANINDNSDIEGCIVGYRDLVGSRQEVYRSCVNQSSGTITRTVPGTSNNYYITGELEQNGFKGYCKDTLIYANQGDFADASGLLGIFATAILVIALSLLFVAKRASTLIASGFGVIVAWLLGITSINGTIVTGIVVFLVIIIIVLKSARSER